MIKIEIDGPAASIESKGKTFDLLLELMVGINILCTRILDDDEGRKLVRNAVEQELKTGVLFEDQSDKTEEI